MTKEFWSQQVLYKCLVVCLVDNFKSLKCVGEKIKEVDCYYQIMITINKLFKNLAEVKCSKKMSEEPSGGGTTFSLVAITLYTILEKQSFKNNPVFTKQSFKNNP